MSIQNDIKPSDNVSEPPQKIAYEWVVSRTKGEDVFLSEVQFEFYKQQLTDGDTRQIIFSDVLLNPVYVTGAYKQKAETLKYRYPCMVCHSSGRKVGNTGWCEKCGGSGVDFNNK